MIVPPCCMGCSPSSCQESLLLSLTFLSQSSHPLKVFLGIFFHNAHPLKVPFGEFVHNVLFRFSSFKLHRLTFMSQSSHPLKVFLGKFFKMCCFASHPGLLVAQSHFLVTMISSFKSCLGNAFTITLLIKSPMKSCIM